jgi:hypothetical protein
VAKNCVVALKNLKIVQLKMFLVLEKVLVIPLFDSIEVKGGADSDPVLFQRKDFCDS